MKQLNNKVDGAGGETGSLPADEWNQTASELQNVIESTDQTLNGAVDDQLVKAVSAYAAKGDFFEDSGTVNAYDVAPIGDYVAPASLQAGMTVRFIPQNNNTGPSTVNYAGLGAVSIKMIGGGELTGVELVAGQQITLQYNGTEWEILPQYVGSDGKNLLLNSNFRRSRRFAINGNSELFDFFGAPTNSNYGPDMWAVSSARTIERVFNDNPSYSTSKTSLRGKIASGSTGTRAQLLTAVELFGDNQAASDAVFPVGSTYTLSFAHKAPAGEDLLVNLYFRDGVGISGNDVVVNNTTFSSAGTGSWSAERKSVTFTIPNLPAATNQCLELNIAGSLVTAGDQTTFIQLADVKLERGSVATPYVAPDRIEEEAKTARYCLDNSTGGAGQHTGFIVGPTEANVMIGTNTRMRVPPTFVTENNANVLKLNYGGSTDSVTPSSISRYGADIRMKLVKVGGGNLSVTSGACYLRVDDNYVLDASL